MSTTYEAMAIAKTKMDQQKFSLATMKASLVDYTEHFLIYNDYLLLVQGWRSMPGGTVTINSYIVFNFYCEESGFLWLMVHRGNMSSTRLRASLCIYIKHSCLLENETISCHTLDLASMEHNIKTTNYRRRR